METLQVNYRMNVLSLGCLLGFGLLTAACSSSSDVPTPEAACVKAMSLLPEEQRSDETKAACTKALGDFKASDPKMYECVAKCTMKASTQDEANQCNPSCGYNK